jgi:ribosomal subunit interface protein
MNITLKATGIELTDAITEYSDKKVRTLEKYLKQPTDAYIARVEVGKTTNHHKEGAIFKAEIHLSGNGINIYAVKEAEDLYAAIDLVQGEAARELQSGKGRHIRLMRKGQRAIKEMMKGISDRFSSHSS